MEEPFIMLQKSQRIRQVIDHIFDKAKISPKIILTTASFETARRLCCRSMGITMAPIHYCSIFSGGYDASYFLPPEECDPSWNLALAMPT